MDWPGSFSTCGRGVAGAHGPVTQNDLILHRRWGAEVLEVYHPCHSKDQVTSYYSWAIGMGYAATGGSDFHAPGPFRMGHVRGRIASRLERELRQRWVQGKTTNLS